MLETIQWTLGNLHQVGTHSHTHQMKISWFVRQKAIKTMRVLSLFLHPSTVQRIILPILKTKLAKMAIDYSSGLVL